MRREGPTSLCWRCSHPRWQHFKMEGGKTKLELGPCQIKRRRSGKKGPCDCPAYERNPNLEPML